MEIFSRYIKSEDGNNLYKTTCPLTRNSVLFKWLETQAEPIWPCTERICFHQTKKIKCWFFSDTGLLLPLCTPGPLLPHKLRSTELHVVCCWGLPHPSPSASWGCERPLPPGRRVSERGRVQSHPEPSWRIYSLPTLKCGFIQSVTSWLWSLIWSKMLIMLLFNMIYRTLVTAGQCLLRAGKIPVSGLPLISM